VPDLPRDLQNEAIRKPKRRLTPEAREGSRNHIGILKRDVRVIQEHVYRGGALLGVEFVDGFQNPQSLGENNM
jgi:hypothetical protein